MLRPMEPMGSDTSSLEKPLRASAASTSCVPDGTVRPTAAPLTPTATSSSASDGVAAGSSSSGDGPSSSSDTHMTARPSSRTGSSPARRTTALPPAAPVAMQKTPSARTPPTCACDMSKGGTERCSSHAGCRKEMPSMMQHWKPITVRNSAIESILPALVPKR